MWRVRKFFRNIKRIIKWIPRLWNNEEFAYDYALNVLKYKLEDIADHMEKQNRFENTKHYVSRLRTTVRLIDKVYGYQDYDTDGYDKVIELYGERNFDFTPLEDRPDCSRIDISFKNKYTEEELEVIEKHEKLIREEHRLKQEKAHKLVWKMIEHNLYKWWD